MTSSRYQTKRPDQATWKLGDSDDEEDVPDQAAETLSKVQRRRREQRLEREEAAERWDTERAIATNWLFGDKDPGEMNMSELITHIQ